MAFTIAISDTDFKREIAVDIALRLCKGADFIAAVSPPVAADIRNATGVYTVVFKAVVIIIMMCSKRRTCLHVYEKRGKDPPVGAVPEAGYAPPVVPVFDDGCRRRRGAMVMHCNSIDCFS